MTSDEEVADGTLCPTKFLDDKTSEFGHDVTRFVNKKVLCRVKGPSESCKTARFATQILTWLGLLIDGGGCGGGPLFIDLLSTGLTGLFSVLDKDEPKTINNENSKNMTWLSQ